MIRLQKMLVWRRKQPSAASMRRLSSPVQMPLQPEQLPRNSLSPAQIHRSAYWVKAYARYAQNIEPKLFRKNTEVPARSLIDPDPGAKSWPRVFVANDSWGL